MTRSSTTPTPGLSGSPEPAGWVSCPACGWLLYRKRLDRNLHVCPECDHHLRLSARARLDLLVDPDTFTETTFPPPRPPPPNRPPPRPPPPRCPPPPSAPPPPAPGSPPAGLASRRRSSS